MSTSITTRLPIKDSNVCRLCQIPCNGQHNCINDDNAQMNEVYRITLRYFPAKFLEPSWSSSQAALCLECWRHIIEFYSFQESIFETQKKLLGRQHEVDIDMKDITILPRNGSVDVTSGDIVNCDVKPKLEYSPVSSDLKLKNVASSNENDQNVGKETTDVKNDDGVFMDGFTIDISLSDLEDIDIQFSSDDEMPVTKSLDTQKGVDLKPALQNPTRNTSQCNVSLDSLTCDGKEKKSKDKSSVDEDIDHGKPKLECWICNKSVATFKLLQDHFQLKHRSGQCYTVCCQSKFTSKHQFEEHLRSKHTHNEGFKCEECKIECSSLSILEKHKLQKHPEIVQNFRCPECPMILPTSDQLEKHFNAHFACQECSKVFRTTAGLKSHTRAVHIAATKRSTTAVGLKAVLESSSDGETPVKKCRKDFQVEAALQNPTRTTSQCNVSPDSQTCDGKETTSKNNTSVGEDIDQFIARYKPILDCWICSKPVATFALLQSHFRLNHRSGQCYILCCQRKLISRHQIEQHIRSKHTHKEAFMCEECKIGYPSASTLEKHKLQTHPEIAQQFSCPECPMILSTSNQLEKHYNSHFVCQECSKVFQTTEALKCHTATVHIATTTSTTAAVGLNDVLQPYSEDEIAVKKCRMEFKIESALQNPIRTTAPHKVFQEPQTSDAEEKKSKDYTSVDEDIDEFIAKHKPKLDCWICDKSVTTFELLQDHFSLNHASGQCYITCCKRKLSNRHQVEEHIRFKHIEKKGYMCEVCKIEYPKASILKKHQIQRHPEIVGNFNCPECPMILSTSDQLEKHYNAHFVCQECSKVFKSTDGLKSHTRMVHITTEQTATMTGSSKTFTCEQCGKTINSKSIFENHQRYAHNDDCKYKCNICEKAFKKVLHFRDHMNYHSSDNYYPCPHCSKKFQYWSHLESHMKSAHLKMCSKKHMLQILLAEQAFDVQQGN